MLLEGNTGTEQNVVPQKTACDDELGRCCGRCCGVNYLGDGIWGPGPGTWIGKTKCTPVNIWDYAGKIVNKPEPSDPKTWDWTPALEAAAATGRARSRTRKTSQSPMKAKRHDSAKTDFSCDRNMFPKSNDFDLGI